MGYFDLANQLTTAGQNHQWSKVLEICQTIDTQEFGSGETVKHQEKSRETLEPQKFGSLAMGKTAPQSREMLGAQDFGSLAKGKSPPSKKPVDGMEACAQRWGISEKSPPQTEEELIERAKNWPPPREVQEKLIDDYLQESGGRTPYDDWYEKRREEDRKFWEELEKR